MLRRAMNTMSAIDRATRPPAIYLRDLAPSRRPRRACDRRRGGLPQPVERPAVSPDVVAVHLGVAAAGLGHQVVLRSGQARHTYPARGAEAKRQPWMLLNAPDDAASSAGDSNSTIGTASRSLPLRYGRELVANASSVFRRNSAPDDSSGVPPARVAVGALAATSDGRRCRAAGKRRLQSAAKSRGLPAPSWPAKTLR